MVISADKAEAVRLAWLTQDEPTLRSVAEAAGVSTYSARRHKPSEDEFKQTQTREKKLEIEARATDRIVAGLEQAVLRLLPALTNPDKIDAATLQQVGTTIGIVIDKLQLIQGKATARTETMALDPNRLTTEERAQLSRLRAKLAGEAPR